jgi:cyclopropane fatty-acyl-phospholipid synthase-like methyltransferase
LKIAEVGCGTGTFALTFALLGASVTLIDSNEEALKNAEKIYKMYGCTTQCVKANVLDSPPDNLRKSFDVAISGGLAEHFIGKNLASCISFHRRLDIRRPDCTGQIESLAEKSNSSYKHNLLSDQFSAGIILFGFN